MPIPASTIPVLKGMKARNVADLQASIDFLQKHYDKLKEKTKAVKKLINKQKVLIANIQAMAGVA